MSETVWSSTLVASNIKLQFIFWWQALGTSINKICLQKYETVLHDDVIDRHTIFLRKQCRCRLIQMHKSASGMPAVIGVQIGTVYFHANYPVAWFTDTAARRPIRGFAKTRIIADLLCYPPKIKKTNRHVNWVIIAWVKYTYPAAYITAKIWNI